MRFLNKLRRLSKLRSRCLRTTRNSSSLSNRKTVSNSPRSGTKLWLRLMEPSVWHLRRAPSHLKKTTLLKTIKSIRSKMTPPNSKKLFLRRNSSSSSLVLVFKKRRRIATLSLLTMTTIRASHTSPPITSRNLHPSISLSRTTSQVSLNNKSSRRLSAGLNLTAKVLTIMSVLMTNNFLKITSKKEMILMEMLALLISPTVTMWWSLGSTEEMSLCRTLLQSRRGSSSMRIKTQAQSKIKLTPTSNRSTQLKSTYMNNDSCKSNQSNTSNRNCNSKFKSKKTLIAMTRVKS